MGTDMDRQARAGDVITDSNKPVGPGTSTHNVYGYYGLWILKLTSTEQTDTEKANP